MNEICTCIVYDRDDVEIKKNKCLDCDGLIINQTNKK